MFRKLLGEFPRNDRPVSTCLDPQGHLSPLEVWVDDGEELWIGVDLHHASYEIECIEIFQSPTAAYRAEV